MRTSTFLIAAALTLSTAACDDPADAVPAAETAPPVVDETEPSPPAEPAPAQNTGPLAIDAARSTVGFTGSKVTGSHTGSFGEFTGAITYRSAIESSSVEITIQMASVTTDSERLTGHLKADDFFGVETFPTATFRSSEIVSAPSSESGTTHNVTGSLTLHGQSKDIRFPATITANDQEVTAQAEFSINRKDFGIEYAGMPDDLIRDAVVIRFNVVAPRAQ